MRPVPEDRPAAHERGSFKLWYRFLLAIGWLLLVAGISFVRGPGRPGRPEGQPETWKVCLFVALTVVAFGGFVAVASYGHPHTMPPGLAH